MKPQDRLARLRSLVGQLEEQGASPERDGLLREIRLRIALLEVGPREWTGWSRPGWSDAEEVSPPIALLLDP